MEVNIHEVVKEWPITATSARGMAWKGRERRVYITLRSPLGKEKGRTLTVYRIPFSDVVKRMKAAFGRGPPEHRKEKRDKIIGRPLLNIKRVYVTMQPATPGPGKTRWSRRRRRGRSVQFTAYNYGVNELRKKIPACLGTILI